MSPSGLLHPDTCPRDGIFDSSLDPLEHQGLGGDPEKSSRELLDAAHATPVRFPSEHLPPSFTYPYGLQNMR